VTRALRRIALSVGDPNGIGPEIVLKALAALRGEDRLQITVFGPAEVLRRAAKACGLEAVFLGMTLRPVGELPPAAAVPGHVNALAGASAVASATACKVTSGAGDLQAAGPLTRE